MLSIDDAKGDNSDVDYDDDDAVGHEEEEQEQEQEDEDEDELRLFMAHVLMLLQCRFGVDGNDNQSLLVQTP